MAGLPPKLADPFLSAFGFTPPSINTPGPVVTPGGPAQPAPVAPPAKAGSTSLGTVSSVLTDYAAATQQGSPARSNTLGAP